MNTFWLKFTDGSSGCCQGYSASDAKDIAEKVSGKKVAMGADGKIAVATLPYPANPVIWQFEHPVSGKCPPFCFSPEKCKGNTACPGRLSCTE